MVGCVGVSGGATKAFKQKSPAVTFVLGKIAGGNVQDGLHGGKD